MPARVVLATEQMLKHIEVPTHSIDVTQESGQVLLRAIHVASQRRHGAAEGRPLVARITTAAPQPAA